MNDIENSFLMDRGDLALMKDVSRGSRESYLILVNRYVDLIFRNAFRILCNREDANAVTLKTFRALRNNILQYDDRFTLAEWLLKKLCIYSRMRITRRRALRFFGVSAELYVGAAPVSDHQDDFLVKQAWELYCRATKRMTPLQCIVFSLYVLEGLPQDRISEMLGLPHLTIVMATRHAEEKVIEELRHYKRDDDYHNYIYFLKKVADSLKSDEIFAYICGHF